MIFNLSAPDGGGGLRMAHGVASCPLKTYTLSGTLYWLNNAPVTGLGFRPRGIYLTSSYYRNPFTNGYTGNGYIWLACAFDAQGNLIFMNYEGNLANATVVKNNLNVTDDGFTAIGSAYPTTQGSTPSDPMSIEWFVYG